jgi:hypothetical protein
MMKEYPFGGLLPLGELNRFTHEQLAILIRQVALPPVFPNDYVLLYALSTDFIRFPDGGQAPWIISSTVMEPSGQRTFASGTWPNNSAPPCMSIPPKP